MPTISLLIGSKDFFKIPGISSIANVLYNYQDKELEVECFGLKFPNPVGLAAGFDKDAKLFDELSAFGFGFVEVGTLTPLGQDGNLVVPRLFRLPEDQSLINRMGFNNAGVDEAILRLKKKKTRVLIGGNIGKNKVTSNENAADDYKKCFHALHPYVDYFRGQCQFAKYAQLARTTGKQPLKVLLQTLQHEGATYDKQKPILLKIAPDLTNEHLDEIIEIMLEIKLDGLIATNTTISREGLKTPKSTVEKIGAGGLSGKAVRARSTEVIRYLSENQLVCFQL